MFVIDDVVELSIERSVVMDRVMRKNLSRTQDFGNFFVLEGFQLAGHETA